MKTLLHITIFTFLISTNCFSQKIPIQKYSPSYYEIENFKFITKCENTEIDTIDNLNLSEYNTYAEYQNLPKQFTEQIDLIKKIEKKRKRLYKKQGRLINQLTYSRKRKVNEGIRNINNQYPLAKEVFQNMPDIWIHQIKSTRPDSLVDKAYKYILDFLGSEFNSEMISYINIQSTCERDFVPFDLKLPNGWHRTLIFYYKNDTIRTEELYPGGQHQGFVSYSNLRGIVDTLRTNSYLRKLKCCMSNPESCELPMSIESIVKVSKVEGLKNTLSGWDVRFVKYFTKPKPSVTFQVINSLSSNNGQTFIYFFDNNEIRLGGWEFTE